MSVPAKQQPTVQTPRFPDFKPGHDEKNLAQFPLALLAKRPPNGLDTVEFRHEYRHPRSGQLITRKVTITGAGKYGLPTPQDQDVLMAFQYLTMLDKQPQDLEDADRTVCFSRRQFFEVIGWPDTGDYYERLKKALRRLKGVTIVYEGWWDEATGQVRSGEIGFSLLDNYGLGDSRKKDKEQLLLFPDVHEAPRQQCFIIWNKVPFASFQQGYVKKLDLATYFCLPTAAAKQAYRYLDADLPPSGQREYDLHAFACEHVGLARSYKPGRLRDEVQKTVVVPLEHAEVIEPLPPTRRFLKRDSHYKVMFGRKIASLADVTADTPMGQAPASPSDEAAKAAASHLIEELRRRKLGGKVAREFVAAHPAEYLQQKIDYFDYQLENATLKNPAAWLRTAIEEDYGEPAGYLPREERQRQREVAEEKKRQAEAKKRSKEQAERLREQREEAEKHRKADHLARIRARLTPAQLHEFERLAKVEASQLFRHYFDKNDDYSLKMRRAFIDAQILKKFPLPELPAE